MNPTEYAHTRAEFRFSLDLAYHLAAPLFGAWAEQHWDPDWHPRFLYPDPPADREGAVFLINDAVWTTTVFDVGSGRVQYVNVIPAASMLTRIDIRLEKSETATEVRVVYERTALDPTANDRVRTQAQREVAFGREWKAAIEASLR
jgi:hypothetical protein